MKLLATLASGDAVPAAFITIGMKAASWSP